MSEIKREPILTIDEDGCESFTFDEDHTWSDVARWVMRNRVDGLELYNILEEMLCIHTEPVAEPTEGL